MLERLLYIICKYNVVYLDISVSIQSCILKGLVYFKPSHK